MGNKAYYLFLDEICDDIFYELEKLSEGKDGHTYEISASNAREAAEVTAKKLVPFIMGKMNDIDNES